MSRRGTGVQARWASIGCALALIAPTCAGAKALHPQLLAKASYGPTAPGFARTADGTLHLAFESNTSWGNAASGVSAVAISPSGHVGPLVQALSWGSGSGSPNGLPGLAVLAGGTLEATFGGSPSGVDGPWGISSSDGGATWSAPLNIGSGSMAFGDSHVNVVNEAGTPVLSAGCCGSIVIQRGFGPASPTYQVTNGSDDAAGNTESAVNGATGATVDSWGSNAGAGGLWLQQVSPSLGAAQKAPIPSQYGTGVAVILAGRDTGSGVFTSYPADFAPTTHMRLLRYGGGSVAVGSAKGLHAASWGVASGLDGRLWVMWAGVVNGKGVTAVTRSNKAVTRFEPIQRYGFTWSTLFTLSGDGRLGPLDMLMGGAPNSPVVDGIYYSRVLPVLSAKAAVSKKGNGKFKLTVTVTDAGDAVPGATVHLKGLTGKTNAKGVAKFTVKGSPGAHVTVTVTNPGYNPLGTRVKL